MRVDINSPLGNVKSNDSHEALANNVLSEVFIFNKEAVEIRRPYLTKLGRVHLWKVNQRRPWINATRCMHRKRGYGDYTCPTPRRKVPVAARCFARSNAVIGDHYRDMYTINKRINFHIDKCDFPFKSLLFICVIT